MLQGDAAFFGADFDVGLGSGSGREQPGGELDLEAVMVAGEEEGFIGRWPKGGC